MRQALTFVALLPLLAACADFPGVGRPSGAPVSAPSPEVREPTRSAQSFEDERFYQNVERGLSTRGLLRADGGGPDTPYTSAMLARTFMALAFSEEFTEVGGRLVRQSSDSALHRWIGNVRLFPIFGPTVTPEAEAMDRAEIERLAIRLARAARHPVSVVESGGNFTVLVLNRDELVESGLLISKLLPEATQSEIDFVENLPRETYCVVLAVDRGNTGNYTRALAIVRAELPNRLRTSCLHEEISQGFGLANDSPNARPSIFNDDDEFGRLTSMDELLIRMLYDPRLFPGMTAEEAAPIVRRIASELVDSGLG